MDFRKIIIVGYAALHLATLHATDAVVSTYARIGQLTLQAEDKLKTQEVVKEAANPNDPFAIFVSDVSVKPLERAEKQQIGFELFGRVLKDSANGSVLVAHSLEELNVLCGELGSLKTNVRALVDRTVTTYGSLVFARMLAEPTVDVVRIQKRQAFIRALLENEDLYQKCESALLNAHEAESHLLTLWSSKNPLDNKQIREMLFFTWKKLEFLNKSPKLLEAIRVGNITSAVFPVGIYAGMTAVFCAYKKYEYAAGGAALTGYLGYKMYQVVTGLERFKATTQDFMIKTAATVDALRTLADLTYGYDLSRKEQLSNFVQETTMSADAKSLLALLKKNTFKGKSSFFSLLGHSVAAYKHMLDVKDEFVPALEALGEIDALFAIAKLIKEYEHKNMHYCLVDFVKHDTPRLEFTAGWNPLINSDNVVTETMKFGANGINNLLLTGPHGSGKSSFMREAMYMIILGQTFGIAPATTCVMTPFSKLSTYLNIKEDYSQGLSTFMAERKRVDEIKDTLTTLQPGEFAFSVMDEVFKGTMEEEGAKRVHRFGKEIAGVQQSICLMATHFNFPTILEHDTHGRFVNYHVGLEEYKNGSFKRIFKLVPGKNAWWFNDSDKRDRFIEWLQTVAS